MIKFEWDESKNQTNINRHGLSFNDAAELFDGLKLTKIDRRVHYGEDRYISFGFIKERLMVLVFAKRELDIVRIISLRKANKREQAYFKKTIQDRLEKG